MRREDATGSRRVGSNSSKQLLLFNADADADGDDGDDGDASGMDGDGE
eukprot:CAMPEP_0171651968 /NCGR_PEP_ID=MMETSP0990-20121206/38665_1 /TAXON_ID=483369 /ORGANISM="non described non described, Strain CCMP2098" /LENGTH=47 /DNA_ID= /DNA_START= /DNA_END= /DNA_ORIENTATION=